MSVKFEVQIGLESERIGSDIPEPTLYTFDQGFNISSTQGFRLLDMRPSFIAIILHFNVLAIYMSKHYFVIVCIDMACCNIDCHFLVPIKGV